MRPLGRLGQTNRQFRPGQFALSSDRHAFWCTHLLYLAREFPLRAQIVGCHRFFATRGRTCALALAKANAKRLPKRSHRVRHARRFFGNGNESCPRGTLLHGGGPRADNPDRFNP